MGALMGSSHANIFLAHIENQLFKQYDGLTNPELYGCYIDNYIVET